MALEGAVQREQEYAIVKEYREQASMLEARCMGQKNPDAGVCIGILQWYFI